MIHCRRVSQVFIRFNRRTDMRAPRARSIFPTLSTFPSITHVSMPNIGAVLKDEIVRLSRKTQKPALSVLQRASADHRRQIAELKRQVASLQRDLARQRKAPSGPSTVTADSNVATHRFQVRGLKSLRARLGLNADDFGKLVGVSGQSIYNWESEKATPRAAQLSALASLRGLGKREVTQRLNGALETTSKRTVSEQPRAKKKR
jgi:DNA-binding XRE family transcriptional regulator